MYDGGNYMSTNSGWDIEYSNDTIVNSAYFGSDGRYFTRKYPGLLVLAADMEGVDYFQIAGNLGADGSGDVDGTILEANLYGRTYYGFVKRIYNAWDPSVNHLVIVADNPSANHTFSANTDDDYHQVYNLSSTSRLYYLLYAGSNGYYIDDSAALNIMQTFLESLGLSPAPSWLTTRPVSDTVPTGTSSAVQVTFDAVSLQPDTYTAQTVVQSNDPLTPSVSVPTTMTVLPTANMGWVEGTVTDASTGDPLEAAIVALGQPYTVTADPATGIYKLWLDAGSYTIQVTAEDYVSETAVVSITAQQGATKDFGLVLNVPVLDVSPESLEVTHYVGDVTTRTMTITNNGPAPLTFKLREFDTGFSPHTALASHLASLRDTTSPAGPDRFHAFTTAYVTLSDDDLVALVDTATHTEVGTVNVGAAGCGHPWRAAMSPDGDRVYVACRDSGNVVIIDTADNTIVTTVGGIYGADGIAFTRDGAYALVGSRWSNYVAVVDPTFLYSATTYIETPSNARSVAAHPYLDVVYATSADGTIQVIDTTTFSITASIPVGEDPHDVAVSPDGRWVFAGSRRGDGLAVIDAYSNLLHTTVTGPGTLSLMTSLTGLEVAPDGSTVYACGQWSGVHVIEGTTLGYITTVAGVGDTWEAAVTCDGSELYVGSKGDQIPVINTATFSVTEQTPLSNSGAHGIAICPQHVARGAPWLSQDPITGTVPGYSSTPIQVTFDATGIQPGTYTADIVDWSNDPFTPTVTVPTTMTVEPTAEMGRVTGVISDAWTSQPLTDATVELVGVYSMTASPDYTIWASAGVYSLTAYASGYASATQSVTIVAGDVVTANLTLEPAQPRLEWTTDDISAIAAEGSSVTQTFMISNTGSLPLDIALFEINPTAVLQAMSPLSPGDLNGKRILYDRAHGEPDSSEYSNLINDAITAGAAITESWYTIDAALLEGYDVLWVNCCGYTAWGFGELNAVSDWMSQGGAVLVQGESSDATDGAASVFGISYQSGSCSSGTTTDIEDHPISEGVTAVSVEWTCWRLAPSLGVDVVVSDGEGQPHVVAQEQNGGKMVVVASEDFIDWHINNVNNRILANNILAWLARPAYSDVPWLSETPQSDTISGHSSLPVTLRFDATGLSQGDYQATLAIEHNDLFQSSPAELPVTLSVVAPQAALSLIPALQERKGAPGETVVHTFTLTNQGNANDTFSLNASGVWTPTLSADTTGSLGVHESFVFTLGVTIPSAATHGISDTTTITARSTLDSGVSESVRAMTTAISPYRIYLPLVIRNSP
jgi:YVTN family beta-propeller protein